MHRRQSNVSELLPFAFIYSSSQNDGETAASTTTSNFNEINLLNVPYTQSTRFIEPSTENRSLRHDSIRSIRRSNTDTNTPSSSTPLQANDVFSRRARNHTEIIHAIKYPFEDFDESQGVNGRANPNLQKQSNLKIEESRTRARYRSQQLHRRFHTTDLAESFEPSFMKDPEAYAEKIIDDAIENGTLNIFLASCNLTRLPENISQLNNLIVPFVPGKKSSLVPKIQLWLYSNKLQTVELSLFTLKNLSVLSLRANLITYIPESIAKLENLVEINVSSNLIKFFPSTIFELKKLENFCILPNPLIEYDENDECTAMTQKLIAMKNQQGPDSLSKYMIYLKPISEESFKKFPTLIELCLREFKKWGKPPTFYQRQTNQPIITKLLDDAYEASLNYRFCAQCNTSFVHECLESFEWWNRVFKQDKIPVRRLFCRGRCAKLYYATYR